jgi:hypothetical protein
MSCHLHITGRIKKLRIKNRVDAAFEKKTELDGVGGGGGDRRPDHNACACPCSTWGPSSRAGSMAARVNNRNHVIRTALLLQGWSLFL